MDHTVENVVGDFFAKRPTKTYEKNAILAMPGKKMPHIFYLIDGTIEQYDITPEGNKAVVNIFKPGAFFPMSSAINQTPNDYFFAALTEVRVQLASPEATVQFLKDTPEVTFDLLSRVYRGTDALLKRLVLASSGLATTRLIFELIVEGYRFGVTGLDGSTTLSVKQSSLAARSGLARETINRELHKLEQEGLVELTAGSIIIQLPELEARLNTVL